MKSRTKSRLPARRRSRQIIVQSSFSQKLGNNKRAVLGEGLLMIYRLVLIAFIALIVLGLAAVFYDYYLDVRDAEARIMAKQVVNCLAPEGVVNLSRFDGVEKEKNLLEACGFDEKEVERFYVAVNITNLGGKQIKKFEQGDSGRLWMEELFKDEDEAKSIVKYRPGDFKEDYFAVILLDNKKSDGKIKLEVFVNHEF